jgi:hypothetical protein
LADASSATRDGALFRGLIGALGGVVCYRLITSILETVLVGTNSDTRPEDFAAYYAVLGRPGVAAAKLALDSVVAVWAGYMAARMATERELTVGALTAAVTTTELAWQHFGGEFAGAAPLWLRAGLLLTTAPAMLAGAWVRGRARVADAAASAESPGEPAR